MPISRLRRRELDAALSKIDPRLFSSLNLKVGWLCIASFPFGAIFASLHPQAVPAAAISHFINPETALRVIKALESTIFCFPADL